MTELNTFSTADLLSGLCSGALDLLEHLEQLADRFAEIEPAVQAFVPEDNRFERLRTEARVLLDRFPEPEGRPLLFGLPVGVKDIFHVDGMTTRAGSRLPTEVLSGAQADVVTDLIQNGALIVGKTVTTEFAYFAPGPTRNPRNPSHTPGGSSSGSAAATAAGLCGGALGTQTIGSVNRPAAFCGVVGFKPTFGRVSTAGVIPLAASLDHVGFFTRGVAGMLLISHAVVPHWTALESLPGPRLAVPQGPYLDRLSDTGQRHFERTVSQMRDASFSIDELDLLPDFEDVVERHNRIVAFEAAERHDAWFAGHADLYHQRTADLIRSGRSLDPDEVEADRMGRMQLRGQIIEVMDRHQIDLWITPSAPGPAPEGLDSTGDPIMNLPWTQSGLPTLTIPSSVAEAGLPLGIQLVARAQADEQLLRWGLLVEAALALPERELQIGAF